MNLKWLQHKDCEEWHLALCKHLKPTETVCGRNAEAHWPEELVLTQSLPRCAKLCEGCAAWLQAQGLALTRVDVQEVTARGALPQKEEPSAD